MPARRPEPPPARSRARSSAGRSGRWSGAGTVVGGATTGPNTTGTVIVEERPPATREQTCIQDSLGNRTCKEVIR